MSNLVIGIEGLVFIYATLDERVKRKCIQYNGKLKEKEVKENIQKRDELQEESGFYKLYAITVKRL